MTPTEFGNRIAYLRNEKKLTQAELAEKLNVSNQAVSKWETGAGFPDVQIIPQLSHILETTTDFLFGCMRKQQKVLVYNIGEGDGTPAVNGKYQRLYKTELNDKYLAFGWRVVEASLSSDGESIMYLMVVLERND